MLAVISGAAVVLTRAGGGSGGGDHRVGLAAGWEGWLQDFSATLGFGGAEPAEKRQPARLGKLTASVVVPAGAMNLAAQHSKQPAVARGSRLATWVATGIENFARGCGKDRDEPCSTGQSSTSGGFAAKNAVDGDSQTSMGEGTCTHTDSQSNPWWKVNFARQIKVTGVRVYGRSDCCEDRLAGFNVYVGNHNYEPDANAACAVSQAAPAGPNYYVDVECTSPLTGTYLFIQVPGADKILTLCEVQVRGEELPPDQGGYDPWGISNQGNPRPDQLPLGASRNTWANIVNNKKNMLWCVENFHYLGQRERCIHGFTGGPLLAKDPHAAQAMLASAPLPPAKPQLSSE